MKNPLVAALLNFFLPGLGYLVAGTHKAFAVLWLVGVLGLTWVEFAVKEAAPDLYLPMFISVLIMNTAFAIDAFQAAKRNQVA